MSSEASSHDPYAELGAEWDRQFVKQQELVKPFAELKANSSSTSEAYANLARAHAGWQIIRHCEDERVRPATIVDVHPDDLQGNIAEAIIALMHLMRQIGLDIDRELEWARGFYDGDVKNEQQEQQEQKEQEQQLCPTTE